MGQWFEIASIVFVGLYTIGLPWFFVRLVNKAIVVGSLLSHSVGVEFVGAFRFGGPHDLRSCR